MQPGLRSTPRVFISYSRESNEHDANCLGLADRLNLEGVDTSIDVYIVGAPPEGWIQWMVNEIEIADYVLVVATETYNQRFRAQPEGGRGLGAIWEGAIINAQLYTSAGRNEKFIPIVFSSEDRVHIPLVLRSTTYYDLSAHDGYERLYRAITNQPKLTKPPLGTIVPMPARQTSTPVDMRMNSEEYLKMRSRGELFNEVWRLLAQNGMIFHTFGPSSSIAQRDMLTSAVDIWNKRRTDTIIPNNAQIVNLLDTNRQLLTEEEYLIFLTFQAHSRAFEDNQLKHMDGSSVPMFPDEFSQMIDSARKGAAENV